MLRRPPASSSTASASSRTTARRCAATGSTRASSPRRATTRSAASTADPTGPRHVPQLGLLLAGQPPRHVQPRVRRRGRQGLGPQARRESSGTARSGSATCPTSSPTRLRASSARSSCCPKGVGRLFAAALNDGPFPEHYEADRGAGRQPAPSEGHVEPGRRKKFSSDKDVYGKREDFPIVCTTYRLTEHFHYWTQHQHDGVLNQLQPGFFVEIPEGLAQREGHRQRVAGQGHVGARLDRGRRDGHQAPAPDEDRRQGDVADRVPDPLGLCGRRHRATRARSRTS